MRARREVVERNLLLCTRQILSENKQQASTQASRRVDVPEREKRRGDADAAREQREAFPSLFARFSLYPSPFSPLSLLPNTSPSTMSYTQARITVRRSSERRTDRLLPAQSGALRAHLEDLLRFLLVLGRGRDRVSLARLHYQCKRANSFLSRLDLGAPTSSISLNAAAPLVLLAAVLVHSAEPNERGCPSSTSYNEQRELVTLEFGREFPRGKAVLALRWEGRLDAGTLLGEPDWQISQV